ncbi:T9SS type A sorting domain-containing protein [Flavobacterium cerinum]|uniref:T9SS type A sorting domain-containing protein n=1 Tax=Flavobacterium cerinum TaxID=2502784 RepID=A0ABY5ITN7_9FLAO|nr:T9SS type A sorting domain-containing protein [Flavobacterium cerinum]UUC46019.1 T9SS type A sorting domain-containing protein [Flavobacterium cerinum]
MKKNYVFTLLTCLITLFAFGTCPTPTGLSVTGVTSNSAQIGWIGNIQTEWEVYITPVGTPAPTVNTTGTIVTYNPYIATNLISCTSYNVYVRSVCSPTEFSNWSAAITFNTKLGLNSDIPAIEVCDSNNDGITSFDLTSNNYAILYGLNPNEYTVSFHETPEGAYNNTEPITTPTSYLNINPYTMTIYVRVANLTSGCFGVVTFNIIVHSSPSIHLPYNSYICYDNTTSTATPYIINTYLSPNQYTFEWYKDSVIIAGATGSSFTTTTAGVYSVVVHNIITGCTINATTAITYSNAPTASADIDNQTVTITTTGPGNFKYLIDNEPAQLSNIFENVALGTHTIQVIPTNSSCPPFYLTITVTTPSSPLGQTTQTFTQGQTLANLVITGQNIQWYATPGTAGLTSTTETPLPMSTVLAHNTTYYASQTINGIESPDRLAVTAMMVLNNDDFTFKKLVYYPNPISNNLTISNQEAISAITISNLLGQTVVDKKINSNQYDVDFSGLSKGIYLVKVTANNQSKTFKVIKE